MNTFEKQLSDHGVMHCQSRFFFNHPVGFRHSVINNKTCTNKSLYTVACILENHNRSILENQFGKSLQRASF